MRSICPFVLLLLLGVGAGVADTLTADLVRSAKGDGPDGKGNTSDDTWQFWFELAHKRGSFERLDTHSKSVPKEGIAKKITGPIAGLLPNPADSAGWIFHRDWDGRFEGVWGDSKTGNVLLYPYVEKNAHMAVAVSYTVPADGPHDISGSLTDLQVAPDFKQHDGVEWTIEIVEAGKAARQVGKGGPLGDGHGRPDRNRFHIQAVELKKGQLVRLCVHPRKWWGTDLTRIEAFCIEPSRPTQPRHGVVFADGDTFAGWPANGGLWSWADGEEALVAFVTGKYVERKGHNLEKPYTNRLGRTRDGGKTWTVEVPVAGFYQPKMKVEPLAKAIPFQAEGFAMRVVAEGYHGAGVSPGAAVCFTTDRGKTWQGPYALPELLPGRLAEGRDEITARTDYIVLGPEVCLLLATARPKDRSAPDRPFAVRLSEGGRKAEFLGWMTDVDNRDRHVMPSTIRATTGELISTLRVKPADGEECRVDAYHSLDQGKTWKRLGKVGDTGRRDGNPPALIQLRDGRLCCAYGDRSRCQMLARFSGDLGRTWGSETVLREAPQPDTGGEKDFGYSRLFQRPDGDLVVVYYWASPQHPTGHIATTTWRVPTIR